MTQGIARLTILCALITLFGRSSSAEELILVPPGTYNLGQIITRSGTSANWIRYKPLHGGVVVRGGAVLDKPFVILDGFLFDGNLHPRAPEQTGALSVVTSNVRVENSELRGPKDIHTGYNANDEQSCGESDGFPNGGAGLSVQGQEVVLDNVVIHGFYSAGGFRKGSTVRVRNSLIRNNFNGITFNGTFVEVRDSVFWVNPNHLNSISTPGGSVHLINNLIVDAQEANMVWCDDCVSEFVFVHNTVYVPANRLCGEMSGIKTAMVKDSVVVRDNIVVLLSGPFVGSSTETQAMISDFNFFYQHHPEGTPDEFRYGPRKVSKNKVSRSAWLSLGRDSHSIFDTLPAFQDPPRYGDFAANQWGFRVPRSTAEARGWFVLKDQSRGTRAASDKLDMGISRSPISPDTSSPRRAIPRAPQAFTIVE